MQAIEPDETESSPSEMDLLPAVKLKFENVKSQLSDSQRVNRAGQNKKQKRVFIEIRFDISKATMNTRPRISSGVSPRRLSPDDVRAGLGYASSGRQVRCYFTIN